MTEPKITLAQWAEAQGENSELVRMLAQADEILVDMKWNEQNEGPLAPITRAAWWARLNEPFDIEGDE